MDLSGKKVVVTGGAGFIGSHIVDRLLYLGADVVVIDDLSTGNRENIKHVINRVHFIEGSILNKDLLRDAFRDAYAVSHQAAIPSVPKSIEFPMETNMANSVGTLAVLLAAREVGVDRVVFASSSSVYGDTPVMPKVETMTPSPQSPYAVHKLTGELYGKLFNSLYNLKTIGLRYFNIFGPRQNPNSPYSAVIPKFISIVKKGERPIIFGDGEHTRDFTYVDNAVEANILALVAKGGFGEVYNVAAGKRISLNQLVEKIGDMLGTKIYPEYVSPRQGDVKDSFADIEKAEKILGYKPKISFDEGLRLTVDSIMV